MIQRRNFKKSFLVHQLESIFRKQAVKREYYHGAKFNGVYCIGIMDQSKDLFVGSEDGPFRFLGTAWSQTRGQSLLKKLLLSVVTIPC